MRWLRVEDPSAAAACRGAALALASRLDFPAARADQVALAVTEAASNLHKHASQGSMLLRIAPGRRQAGHRDGDHRRRARAAATPARRCATAIPPAAPWASGSAPSARLADFCDLYSVPGHGTVLVARFWPQPPPGPVRCAGLVRPITGETECGDVFGVAETDGSCHRRAVRRPRPRPARRDRRDGGGAPRSSRSPAAEPAVLVERAHRRMDHTRGGAIGVVQVAGPVIRFAGLGNIAAVILADGTRKGMLSVPGIAGHQARTIRQFEYDAPPGAAIILHSDGISGRWEPRRCPA